MKVTITSKEGNSISEEFATSEQAIKFIDAVQGVSDLLEKLRKEGWSEKRIKAILKRYQAQQEAA
jgi:microsomal dipeptidase-like Zn-dependent dipeptidase